MKKIFFVLFLLFFVLQSCTKQQRARNWGGSVKISIPNGETFINATWKDDNLWIITYDSANKVFKMHESSAFGVFEGTVTITP